jgi:hypothetical protein
MSALAHAIEQQANQARALFHRLVLVVGEPGSGKTAALHELSRRHQWPLVNLNAALSERLLELNAQQRRIKTAELVQSFIAEQCSDTTMLDNISILFRPELKQNPLQVLQRAARNQTVIAAWQGALDSTGLSFAVPGHPEYLRISKAEALLVDASLTREREAAAK